jgi:hypothetical protein
VLELDIHRERTSHTQHAPLPLPGKERDMVCREEQLGQLVPERMVLRKAWRPESGALRALVEVAELVQWFTKTHRDVFLLGAVFPAHDRRIYHD